MNQFVRTTLFLFFTLSSINAATAQIPDRIETFSFESTTLSNLIGRSPDIALLELMRVEEATGEIVYRKLRDLKGRAIPSVVTHRKNALPKNATWTRPGRRVVAFYQEGNCAVCLGRQWYLHSSKGQVLPLIIPVWPTILYSGTVSHLEKHVRAILAGDEVTITIETYRAALREVQQPRDWVRGEIGEICRIRASLNITSEIATELQTGKYYVGPGPGTHDDVPSWIAALRDPDDELRAEACENLGTLGPAAIAARLPLIKVLEDPDSHVRLHAAAALTRVDPQAQQALPVLLAGLQENKPELRQKAARLLGSLPKHAASACPALVLRLQKDQDFAVRTSAAYALGEIGPDLPPGDEQQLVIRGLIEILQSDHAEDVRLTVITALKRFGTALIPCVPRLYSLLESPFPGRAKVEEYPQTWRASIAEVIASAGKKAFPFEQGKTSWSTVYWFLDDYQKMGPRAKSAFPALQAYLRENEPGFVHLNATAPALAAIDPKRAAPLFVPLLQEGLKDSDRGSRGLAFALIGQLQQETERCVPELLAIVNDSEATSNDRIYAIKLMGLMGPRARGAWGTLYLNLSDRWNGVPVAVALCRIDPGSASGLRSLEQQLKRHPDRYRSVAQALSDLGRDASPAVPTVLQALHRAKDPEVRIHLALALMRIGRAVEADGLLEDQLATALDVLRFALKANPHPFTIHQIGDLGHLARPLLPDLLRLLNDDEERTLHVIRAVRRIGGTSPDALKIVQKHLRPLLDLENLSVRWQSAILYCHFFPKSKDGIDEIIRHLDHDAASVDLKELQELGEKARPTVPSLLKALRRNPNEYWPIVNAIHKIDPAAAAKHHLP